MKKNRYFYILILLALATTLSNAQELIKNRNSGLSLAEKWKWALKQDAGEEYWIAYSFEKWMHENSYVGHICDDDSIYPTLQDILNHPGAKIIKSAKESVTGKNRKTFCFCEGDSGKKVLKEIAILLKVGRNNEIIEADISNLSQTVDLENLSLVWLGTIPLKESRTFLINLYKNSSAIEIKKDLLTTLAVHPSHQDIVHFLKKVIESREDSELRKSAVFWLGNQDFAGTAEYLKNVVYGDRSREVRKEAVFALSLIDSEEATNMLIDVARNNRELKIRKSAIFWLGQKASKKSADFLEETVYSNEETEIQKQAVFALAQLDNDKSLDKLIKVAQTHPNIKVRKNAIFWLGQSEDERALNAIVEFIKRK